MLNIIHLQVAVAAAKRQFELIRTKYPDLEAHLVMSLPGGETGIDSSPAQILREFPDMVVDDNTKAALLSFLSRLKESESRTITGPETERLRGVFDRFADQCNYDEKCLVELRFKNLNRDSITTLQADDLVDRNLTPQTKDSCRIVLGTLERFARASSGTPAANLFVEISGELCEAAICSLDGCVYSRSLRVGCDSFDEAVVAYLQRTHNLLIGDAAKEIRARIGSAFPLARELTMEVTGRDLDTGLAKTLTIRSEEIREALQEPLSSIRESVLIASEHCPLELSPDLVAGGIVITGSGALLHGLDRLLAEATHLPVRIADDPKAFKLPIGGFTINDLR